MSMNANLLIQDNLPVLIFCHDSAPLLSVCSAVVPNAGLARGVFIWHGRLRAAKI
jgi:hypothetical protein